jgi:phosphoglycolate phosphatase-like HAD superfamily hydrolase
VLVTFDLFSALIDSRAGGSAALGELARAHGWDVDGGRLYDLWDAHNKASQAELESWVPFAEHCRRALAATYLELRRAADADDDTERLRAYKPRPVIYHRAREAAGGDLLHVATSARDVRGAVAAGVPVVRLRRPGHNLDPSGPRPEQEVSGLAELGVVLDRTAWD